MSRDEARTIHLPMSAKPRSRKATPWTRGQKIILGLSPIVLGLVFVAMDAWL